MDAIKGIVNKVASRKLAATAPTPVFPSPTMQEHESSLCIDLR